MTVNSVQTPAMWGSAQRFGDGSQYTRGDTPRTSGIHPSSLEGCAAAIAVPVSERLHRVQTLRIAALFREGKGLIAVMLLFTSVHRVQVNVAP